MLNRSGYAHHSRPSIHTFSNRTICLPLMRPCNRAAEISETVQDQVGLLLDEKDLPRRDIVPEDRLNADLGLTSLDLASLVAALEMKLKADPFQELVPITSIRTVGDLEAAYVKYFTGSDSEQEVQDEELAKIRRRAEARRAGAGGSG